MSRSMQPTPNSGYHYFLGPGGVDDVGRVGKFGAVRDDLQTAVVEEGANGCHPKIPTATLRENVIEREGSVVDGDDSRTHIGESRVIVGGEFLAPIHLYMIVSAQKPGARGC